MSFFIRKGHDPLKKNSKKRKISKTDNKSKKAKKEIPDEEIDSDLEDNPNNNNHETYEENEIDETPQEKKLRLAKLYLSQLQEEEQRRNESKSLDKEALAARLHDDVLEQSGRLVKRLADSIVGHGPEQILRCKFHKLSITCIAFSTDNDSFFTGSKDGGLVKWSLKNKSKLVHLKNYTDDMKIKKHPSPILSLAISSDNKYLAAGLKNNNIIIFCPNTLNHIQTFKKHKGPVTGVSFRKNSLDLYSCSLDKSVKIWNLNENAYIETLFGHQDGITSIDALHRERAITTGGRDNSVRIWKIVEQSQLIFNGLGTSLIEVVKLINEECFVTGDDQGNICLWTSQKKKPIYTIKLAHGKCSENDQPYWISSLATLTNTDIIASGSYNGYIQLWKCKDFKSLTPLMKVEAKGFVNHLAFTNDGSDLIAGIGQEHKGGRWWSIKDSKNGIMIIPLNKTNI